MTPAQEEQLLQMLEKFQAGKKISELTAFDGDALASLLAVFDPTADEMRKATISQIITHPRTRKTDFSLTDLQAAVADQNLEKHGLHVGDQKTINGRTYVIAGLNPMKGTTTPYRLTQNHVGLIVIPHTTQAWNASGNTSTGADGRGAGYKNCDLHYYLTNTLLPLVETDLGASNLLGHSKTSHQCGEYDCGKPIG